jgi:hypothetical protein
LRWIIIILYIVCFGCYVLFTRQPDYFDSESAIGTIVEKDHDLVASFSDGNLMHYAEVPYGFLHHAGEKVEVIYETADPAKAKQYGLLGYWITFGELVASLIIVMALYWTATSITKNPTPEALIDELESGKKKPRKPKYDL